MSKPQRRDPAKERSWRRWLRLWRRSGLTGRDFCAAHGLSEPSFYAWRRELARRDLETATPTTAAPPRPPPPRPRRQARTARPRPTTPAPATAAAVPLFLPLTPTAAPPSAAIELLLAQGRLLRVHPGFDAELLRQLLRVLEEPTC
jgi:hypothetical protein